MTKSAQKPAICDYEGSSYRSDFWVGKGREYEDRVERIALRKLLPPTGERLVEIGAGFGRLAELYNGYRQVFLVDYAKSQLRQAQEALGGDRRFVFVAADLYRQPFSAGYFDTVVTVRVLHHVQDLTAAFTEIARVLNSKGTYVFEYANKRHLRAIMRYVLGRGRPGENPFSPEPYEFVPLNFDFHPSFLAECLGVAGLEIETELSVSLFRLGILKRYLGAGPLASLDGLLQGVTAQLRLTPSQFVRSQRRHANRYEEAGREGFVCPRCTYNALDERGDGVYCSSCGSLWPVKDGIYDFRVRD
ncbi:MAG: class I SAM-dependent methyltransferase [Chloroflexi bacterium]|nr:class I SAM-dependent methyltransferase [Chloroflexota bacterium]